MDSQLAQNLRELRRLLDGVSPENFSVVVGLDGFVDEIIDVVNKRESFDRYQRMETISELGQRILRAAGLSTNIELVPKTVKLGGNGPIMGNAMCSVGAKVSYVGALGYPDIHAVFHDLADRCQEVFSIAEPGHTDALEFSDGKVMIGKLQSLNDVTWQRMQDQIGIDKMKQLFGQADLIATVNWTMTPYMNEVWQNLLPIVPEPTGKKPIFFVDLADPEKRSNEDIAEAMRLIKRFNQKFRVVLGLNRKEASEVANVLGLTLSDSAERVELGEITQALAASLGIWCLMVHPTMEAAAVCEGVYAYTAGPFTSNPKLTTGAGDNFNSGFCLGLLFGLPLDKALALGKATSGYYVRNMHSPSFDDLKGFVKTWSSHAGEDF